MGERTTYSRRAPVLTIRIVEGNGEEILNKHLTPYAFPDLQVNELIPALLSQLRVRRVASHYFVQAETLSYTDGGTNEDGVELTEAEIVCHFCGDDDSLDGVH